MARTKEAQAIIGGKMSPAAEEQAKRSRMLAEQRRALATETTGRLTQEAMRGRSAEKTARIGAASRVQSAAISAGAQSEATQASQQIAAMEMAQRDRQTAQKIEENERERRFQESERIAGQKFLVQHEGDRRVYEQTQNEWRLEVLDKYIAQNDAKELRIREDDRKETLKTLKVLLGTGLAQQKTQARIAAENVALDRADEQARKDEEARIVKQETLTKRVNDKLTANAPSNLYLKQWEKIGEKQGLFAPTYTLTGKKLPPIPETGTELTGQLFNDLMQGNNFGHIRWEGITEGNVKDVYHSEEGISRLKDWGEDIGGAVKVGEGEIHAILSTLEALKTGLTAKKKEATSDTEKAYYAKQLHVLEDKVIAMESLGAGKAGLKLQRMYKTAYRKLHGRGASDYISKIRRTTGATSMEEIAEWVGKISDLLDNDDVETDGIDIETMIGIIGLADSTTGDTK